MSKRVAIVGAGIAGLTAAAAFAQRGWNARVYEKSASLRVHGAGFALTEPAQNVLRSIGALDAIVAGRPTLNRREARDKNGKLLAHLTWPRPLYFVERATLLNGLYSAACASGAEVFTGTETRVDAESGSLLFGEREREPFDLLIGADGAFSTVRQTKRFAGSRTPLSYGAARALVPWLRRDAQIPEGTWAEYWSASRRLFFAPVSDNSVYVAFQAARSDLQPTDRNVERDWNDTNLEPVDLPSWRQSFPCLQSVFESIEENPTWAPFQEVRLVAWSMENVALIGDAAHAMAPALGMGGTTAMMDAVSIAENVCSNADLSHALWRWESRHRPFVDRLQNHARLWTRISRWPNSIQRMLMKAVPHSRSLSATRFGNPEYVPDGVTA